MKKYVWVLTWIFGDDGKFQVEVFPGTPEGRKLAFDYREQMLIENSYIQPPTISITKMEVHTK